MSKKQLSSVYDPEQVEKKWYEFWERLKLFEGKAGSGRRAFTVVIPPPNVTGSLHMGHALNTSIQDALARWNRMMGRETMWLPGTDHAGIATQHVVEKMLNEQGLSRHDLGREAFIDKVWEWKEQYGDTIIHQLKKLGASCDWSRLRFTMDEGCSRAVREVFVTLYDKGLIYQDDYITNWCPVCGTALSDLEVEHDEQPAKLYYINYPLAGEHGHICVATTRPETMLGDTGIAVSPSDKRFRHLIGKKAVLPIINRHLPIVADEYVDPAFGTGAVKVTPAHDPDDFEIGRRHDLEIITVIGLDGKMTEEAGPCKGMDRYECRQWLIEQLSSEGLLDKETDHSHSLGQCYRCDTVVEPLISRQWFVKMKPLAEPAVKVVEQGQIRFVPDRFTRVYENWVNNIRDWCISRQIWWGHRIPVWYCSDCSHKTVAVHDPDRCAGCGSTRIRQDEDVLDTWFSSALWPFSTLGWPEQTVELEQFFPTDLLVTAYDIIFFWVARMIFMSLEFMGKIPFAEVIIHGVVRDADGQRMSKSRGTGVDPLEAIEKYGADAVRLCLLTGASPGKDQRFRWERFDSSRNFGNKLWNAARFTLMNLDDQPRDSRQVPQSTASNVAVADRWMLSRFERTRERVTELLEQRELGEAAGTLYGFIWDELCDWYIELVKPRLYGDDEQSAELARGVLYWVLERSLRLLHPFMPFITEEIWQAVTGGRGSIVLADWPTARPEMIDEEAESNVRLLMETVRAVRNLRAEVKVPPGKKAEVHVHADQQCLSILADQRESIVALAAAEPLHIGTTGDQRPPRALTEVIDGCEVFLPLTGLVDLEREQERLERELTAARQEVNNCDRRLTDERFVTRAPAEVVQQATERRQAAVEKVKRLQRRIGELSQV